VEGTKAQQLVAGAEVQVADGGDEGADAALRAAHRAKQAGNNEDAVIEALEQAEADYEADHAGACLPAYGRGSLTQGGGREGDVSERSEQRAWYIVS
jgi:hypothetical protein